ncbi:MAG TPA: hypothetical protein DE315_05805 [Candidatus Omnitrophica bacterium]|nr:hypothetical protein [Candidatus Omnitrophota bacterium]
MKALITAAGKGTRLTNITRNGNKCLLKIQQQSLLEISIKHLNDSGIGKIVIVTGHAFDQVREELFSKADFAHNPFYEVSGILPSLWLARGLIGREDFVFITGDSIYHPDILKRCIDAPGDIVICVKTGKCDAEAVKVIIHEGGIVDMGKDIPPDQANNEFMGMMKVSPAGNRLVFDMVDQYLRDGRLNAYLSDVLMELQRTGTRIDFINTNGDPYIEIDTPEDYEQAKRCFDNVSHG